MNILFISISSIPNVTIHSISLDLLREFQKNGHHICILCALEKNDPKTTYISEEENFKMLRVQIGGNKKATIVEKGLTTVTEPYKYISAIKKYYADEKFDLVMYPTPPITQVKTVEYVKNRDGAKSYLLLKDIFPQNAVDIGMMKKSGIKGLLYRYFRRVEKKLYKVSDYIGCMSKANVDYVLEHNPEITSDKVGICPNSIDIIDKSVDNKTKTEIRKKYDIPADKIVFVYGGNLSRPQGIPYIIECLKECKDLVEAFFLIVGDGTDYGKIETYINSTKQENVKLMKKLPREDYDSMVGACDIGLIFLDHSFTIPNFPSRLLSYMQAKLPVLACTDPNTDIGKVIVDGGFGWWCESNNTKEFRSTIDKIISSDIQQAGIRGFRHLVSNYDVKQAYDVIMNSYSK